MKSKYVFLLLFVLLVAISNMAYLAWAVENRAPFVSNVSVEQRPGTKLVDIAYDVDDPDGDALTITVAISDDGGGTFKVPAKTFSGDVGGGITPGRSKKIVWDAGVDMPNILGTKYQVKVTANDGKPGSGTVLGRDGAVMTLIPAGKFLMGDTFNEGVPGERPVHTVYLDAFFMDKYEVTNALYAKFLNEYGKEVDAAGHTLINIEKTMIEKADDAYIPKAGYENHPVIYVTWYGAASYAQFYGKRLPTEAEWEKAARGGLEGKRYPWGNDSIQNNSNCIGTGGFDAWNTSSPVGSFPPNDYGLHDMAGNVWEWCADGYGSGYYSVSPMNNPEGPGVRLRFVNNDFTNVISDRILRGGGWGGGELCLRVAAREHHNPLDMYNYGFRCAGF